MINRTITPHIKDAVEFDLRLKPCERVVLDNGTEVYMVECRDRGGAADRLGFLCGQLARRPEPGGGQRQLLVKNGTHKKTAYAINEHFEYFGSYLNRHCYNETANITLHCLNRHCMSCCRW